jgi:hypothetical protein
MKESKFLCFHNRQLINVIKNNKNKIITFVVIVMMTLN